MFSDNTYIKLKELLELLNLSSSDSTKLYNLMQDAYRDGFMMVMLPHLMVLLK
jgi:hypothetical protein